MTVSAGASSVAHGVHYSILAIGLLGLVVLLAPGRTTAVATDEHARRVAALRRSLAGEALERRVVLERPRPLWVPLAVVSTAAAAAVHAAVGPAHFGERVLFGTFFAAAALAQVVWSILATLRPSTAVLRTGAIGNAGLAALWLVTRTVGIPGLVPSPEAVGPWDLACVAWELVAVAACVRALGTGSSYRLAGWARWHPAARAWAAVSVLGLAVLSISGAGS